MGRSFSFRVIFIFLKKYFILRWYLYFRFFSEGLERKEVWSLSFEVEMLL